jgi:hypothetical protein
MSLAIENLAARSLEHDEPLADLSIGDPEVDQHPFEHPEEMVEHFVVHSSLPCPGMSVMEAPSCVSIRAAQRHRKEPFLDLLESSISTPRKNGLSVSSASTLG